MKKNIHRKITAMAVSAMCVMNCAAAVHADTTYKTTVTPEKTGTLTLDYKDDTEGKKPVVGAGFTLYKIGSMVMPVSGGSIIEGIADVPGQANEDLADTSEDTDTADQYKQYEDTADQLDEPDASSDDEDDTDTTQAEKKNTNWTETSVRTYWNPLISGVKADTSTDPVKIQMKVQNAYKTAVKGGKKYNTYTNGSGIARIKGISQGLYLAVETKPAKEHFASIPFLVSMPQMVYSNNGKNQGWCFNVRAYPKSLPAGDLKIGKTVTGSDGQKDKSWHFNVSFDLSKADSTKGTTAAERYTDKFASGEAPSGYHVAQSPIRSKKYGRTYDRASKVYQYTTSDGRKGKIGTKGTISLKSGQTATIRCVPVGTAYKVTEREANRNRYTTRVRNEEGRITQHKVQKVSFVNRRVKRPVRRRGIRNVKTEDATRFGIYVALIVAGISAVILAVRKGKNKGRKDV